MFFPFSNTYNQSMRHPGHRAGIQATHSSRTLELIIKYVGIILGFAWMPGQARHDASAWVPDQVRHDVSAWVSGQAQCDASAAWMPDQARHNVNFGPGFNNYALFHSIFLSGTRVFNTNL